MADIVEELFGAIDTIVETRLQNLGFDKTITCTIESLEEQAIEGSEHKYIVTDGTTKYTVYSTSLYKVGTSVYVIIPNGDYTQKKFIVGYNVSSSDLDMSSVDTDIFVRMTNSYWDTNFSGEFSLLANNPAKKVCFNHDYKFNTDNLPVGYTALCLSAEFATELADFRIIDGDYGIAGIIYGRDKNGALSQMEIKMGCAEMFGNVYNFDGYYPQQLIVNIKDVLNVVEGAQLWFYQNADFTTNKKDLIPHSIKEIDSNNKEIEILYPDNIFVKNISLTFGYNKNDLQNDTFIIKTKDALFFSESDLNKELYLSWVHKHENEYVELNAENLKNYYPESDYEITWQWFEEEKGYTTTVEDNLLPTPWKKIEEVDNKFNINFEPVYTDPEAKVRLAVKIVDMKTVQESLDKLPTDADKDNLKNTYINMYTVKYNSNILTFTNRTTFSAVEVEKKITALYLEHVGANNYNGIYMLYKNISNNLLNQAEANKVRTIMPKFKEGLEDFIGGEIITWRIPKTYSMITLVTEPTEETNTEYIVKQEYNNQAIETMQLQYKIKDVFVPSYVYNTIKCEVEKDSIFYNSEFELKFGPSGSTGTNYSISFRITDEVSFSDNTKTIHAKDVAAIPANLADGHYVEVQAQVFNYNGNLVDTSAASVEWSWWKKNESKELTLSTNLDSNPLIAHLNWKNANNRISTENVLMLEISGVGLENNTLCAYLPIPSKMDADILAMEGIASILYDASGSNPEYYKENYNLIFSNNTDKIKDLAIAIKPTAADFQNNQKNIEFKFRPTPKPKENSITIVPQPLFIHDINQIYYVFIGPKEGVYNATNPVVYWSQPLYIDINKYSSNVLNQWNSDLTINEKNDTILSTSIGAGKKETDNSFSGVFMGNVNNTIGLYGYHHGAESYGFKVDGTAFIGKSGVGRIDFNGSEGTITSGVYVSEIDKNNNETVSSGLKIDLKNARILSPTFKLTQEQGTESERGSIAGWNFDSNKLYKDQVYLYSADQPASEHAVVAGSAKRGDWRIRIGTEFGVTKDGTLFTTKYTTTTTTESLQKTLNSLTAEHTEFDKTLGQFDQDLENIEKAQADFEQSITTKTIQVVKNITTKEIQLGEESITVVTGVELEDLEVLVFKN